MTPPWPQRPPSAAERAAYAQATVRSYWLDSLPPREPEPRLEGRVEADLCIIGGGYTGLWAGLHAVRQDPARRVVVLEAGRCGEGASGRNGGFLEASLTHGLANGLARFPEEMRTLERLGQENFDDLAADLERLSIDAELQTPGYLSVAMEPHELARLEEHAAFEREYGGEATVLSAEEIRAQVNSPLYLGAVWKRSGAGLVHPGKLADGLRQAAVAAGVTVHEHSPVLGVAAEGAGVRVSAAAGGSVSCARTLVGTSACPAVRGVRALSRYVAPVYDYALMTEPLGSRLADIG